MRNVISFLVACSLSLIFSLESFEGFYVGASTGPSALIARQTGRVLGESFATLSVDPYAEILEATWEGNLFFGYGWRWENFFAGLEGFIRYSNNNFSIESENRFVLAGPTNLREAITNEIEIGPWHGGLDFRPGFFLNYNTLVYGRVGAEWTKLNYSGDFIFTNTGTTLPFSYIFSPAEHRLDGYLRLGAGIEKQLSSHLTFRMDYVYTNYRTINLDKVFIAPDTSVLTEDTQMRLKNHSVLLGLSYYFPECIRCCYEPCPPQFDGFYLAGVAGGSFLNTDPQSEARGSVVTTAPVATRINPISFHSNLVDAAFDGALYAGYGLQWRFIYTGVEIFGQYTQLSRTRTDGSLLIQGIAIREAQVDTTIDIKPWQFGVELRPGFILTPSILLYGTVGTSYARTTLHSDGFAQYTSPAGTVRLSLTDHRSQMTLRLGGGAEYAISPLWHLRADYLFTDYGTMHTSGSRSVVAGTVTTAISMNTRVHPQTHSLTVGVARYF